MSSDKGPSQKPNLQVLEGGGGNQEDTRPPVARFGKHTLPEAVIVIRKFVAQYGPPSTFHGGDPLVSQPTHRASRRTLLLATVGAALLATSATTLYFLATGSSNVAEQPPAARSREGLASSEHAPSDRSPPADSTPALHARQEKSLSVPAEPALSGTAPQANAPARESSSKKARPARPRSAPATYSDQL